MAERAKVFVGHSHIDEVFCRELVTVLGAAGTDVWYDEHNFRGGHLLRVIQRELGRRAVFVPVLTKAAFASRWVLRETMWAYELQDRDPSRLILPVTAEQIARDDFSPETGWLFLHDFGRIETPDYGPFSSEEAAHRVLDVLDHPESWMLT